MKKQIIFLEPWTTPMIYKMARVFKKRGYHTISIRVLEYKFLPDSFFKDGFDEIISFNQTFSKLNFKALPSIIHRFIKKIPDVLKARREIKKLNPYLIICRTTPNWLCAITKMLFKNIPLIYFPYDIRAHGDPRLEGYIPVKRGKIIKETLPNFEIKAEKYCFEHADGIIHKGAPDELNYLDRRVMGDDFKICPLQLHFPPYCSEDFIIPFNKNKLSKKDGEIHLVAAESSGSSESSAPASYIVDATEELIKQKIHIHLYLIPNVSTHEETKKCFKENYGFLFKSKYFHYHEPLNPKEIINEVSKYDYAIMLQNLDMKNTDTSIACKVSSGNKISSYIEAGIPNIYYKYHTYIGKIIKEYGVGFSYSNMRDIRNLEKKIKKLNYKAFERNILNARKDFLMEKHFPRMENFIRKVIRKKKLKELKERIDKNER